MWGILMQRIKKLLRREEKPPILLEDSVENSAVDLQNFRAFDQEITSRLRALQLEANVIGRRRMTDSRET